MNISVFGIIVFILLVIVVSTSIVLLGFFKQKDDFIDIENYQDNDNNNIIYNKSPVLFEKKPYKEQIQNNVYNSTEHKNVHIIDSHYVSQTILKNILNQKFNLFFYKSVDDFIKYCEKHKDTINEIIMTSDIDNGLTILSILNNYNKFIYMTTDKNIIYNNIAGVLYKPFEEDACLILLKNL